MKYENSLVVGTERIQNTNEQFILIVVRVLQYIPLRESRYFVPFVFRQHLVPNQQLPNSKIIPNPTFLM